MVTQGQETTHGCLGILFGVNGLCHAATATLSAVHLVQELAVTLLYAGGICQHDGAQITRAVGGIYKALEAFLDQVGQVARVVDVCMRQHHAVHRFRVKIGKISVNSQLLLAVTLVHTAVQKYAPAVHLQQMLGARRCLSCTTKMYFHHSVF